MVIPYAFGRRAFLVGAGAVGCGASSSSAPAVTTTLTSAPRAVDASRERVLCICAHPDDAESGCGGTLIRLARGGAPVTIAYLAHGGIAGKTHEETRKIRGTEARTACALLGATPVLLFEERAPTLSADYLARLQALVTEVAPTVVLTHWPVDTASDHGLASLLTMQAVFKLDPAPELYFFEVERGAQTRAFSPTVYVDITGVVAEKERALMAHQSQDPDRIYDEHHAPMEAFRGREAGYRLAEAFVPASSGAYRLALAMR